MLIEADTVYLAMENEKDQETQAKADAAHQKQIDKLCDLGCEKVIAWMPDPHDPSVLMWRIVSRSRRS